MRAYRLDTINWNDIEAGKYAGDINLNTKTDIFFSLSEVWQHIGHKLKKQRCGYSEIINNIEYRLIPW